MRPCRPPTKTPPPSAASLAGLSVAHVCSEYLVPGRKHFNLPVAMNLSHLVAAATVVISCTSALLTFLLQMVVLCAGRGAQTFWQQSSYTFSQSRSHTRFSLCRLTMVYVLAYHASAVVPPLWATEELAPEQVGKPCLLEPSFASLVVGWEGHHEWDVIIDFAQWQQGSKLYVDFGLPKPLDRVVVVAGGQLAMTRNSLVEIELTGSFKTTVVLRIVAEDFHGDQSFVRMACNSKFPPSAPPPSPSPPSPPPPCTPNPLPPSPNPMPLHPSPSPPHPSEPPPPSPPPPFPPPSPSPSPPPQAPSPPTPGTPPPPFPPPPLPGQPHLPPSPSPSTPPPPSSPPPSPSRPPWPSPPTPPQHPPPASPLPSPPPKPPPESPSPWPPPSLPPSPKPPPRPPPPSPSPLLPPPSSPPPPQPCILGVFVSAASYGWVGHHDYVFTAFIKRWIAGVEMTISFQTDVSLSIKTPGPIIQNAEIIRVESQTIKFLLGEQPPSGSNNVQLWLHSDPLFDSISAGPATHADMVKGLGMQVVCEGSMLLFPPPPPPPPPSPSPKQPPLCPLPQPTPPMPKLKPDMFITDTKPETPKTPAASHFTQPTLTAILAAAPPPSPPPESSPAASHAAPDERIPAAITNGDAVLPKPPAAPPAAAIVEIAARLSPVATSDSSSLRQGESALGEEVLGNASSSSSSFLDSSSSAKEGDLVSASASEEEVSSQTRFASELVWTLLLLCVGVALGIVVAAKLCGLKSGYSKVEYDGSSVLNGLGGLLASQVLSRISRFSRSQSDDDDDDDDDAGNDDGGDEQQDEDAYGHDKGDEWRSAGGRVGRAIGRQPERRVDYDDDGGDFEIRRAREERRLDGAFSEAELQQRIDGLLSASCLGADNGDWQAREGNDERADGVSGECHNAFGDTNDGHLTLQAERSYNTPDAPDSSSQEETNNEIRPEAWLQDRLLV